MNDTMDWEDRFEEKFPPFRGIGARFPIFDTTPNRNHIIQFIRSLLASKQAEMVKKGKQEMLDIIQKHEGWEESYEFYKQYI